MIIPPSVDVSTEKELEKGAMAADPQANANTYADPPPYSPAPASVVYASTSQAVLPSGSVHKEDWTQPSFSRPPSYHGPPPPFTEEMHLVARSSLTQGFPVLSPPFSPNNGEPHPFSTHDVTEQDWTRFLQDIRSSASLTEEQLRATHNMVSFIPVVNILGCVVSKTVRQFMKAHRRRSVPITIENWNHHFFRPRKMEVVLTQGVWKLGNQSSRTPRALQHIYGCHQTAKRDSHLIQWDGLTEKQLRKERRHERREARREHRRVHHSHHHDHGPRIGHDGAYRLWVLPYTD